MSKWRVSVESWEREYEADDEGDALMQADMDFSMMSLARAEEIEPDSASPSNPEGDATDTGKAGQ